MENVNSKQATKTNNPYYKKYAAELHELGISEQDWSGMESREARIRTLTSAGLSHRQATKVVYGVAPTEIDWTK